MRKFDKLAEDLQRLHDALENPWPILEEASRDIIIELVNNELGTATYGQLASAGHPYSKINPQPSWDPAMANFHDGELISSWKVARSGLTLWVFNDSQHAAEMAAGGSSASRMTTRPLLDVLSRNGKSPLDYIVTALDRRLKGPMTKL